MPGWLIFVIVAVVIVGLLFWGSFHRGSDEVNQVEDPGDPRPPREWHMGGGGG